jgi:hypothetical protein
MPLLTEQELERIEALGARWMTEEYLIALIASHREQGALIKELAEACRMAREFVLESDRSRNTPGWEPTRNAIDAALSKVPR